MSETNSLWIYTGGVIEVREAYRESVTCEPVFLRIHFGPGEALAMCAKSKQEAEEKIIDWAKRYSIQSAVFDQSLFTRKMKKHKLIVHIDRDSLRLLPVKKSQTKFYIDEGNNVSLIKQPDEEVENHGEC